MAEELKKELQGLIDSLNESNEIGRETQERAIEILKKLGPSSSVSQPNDIDFFHCPISKEMMIDPRIVSSGITFEADSIKGWLKAGNTTCPVTRELLSRTAMLTPNIFARDAITRWRSMNHGPTVVPPPPKDDHLPRGLTANDHGHLCSLLDRLSSPTLSDQIEGAHGLRSATKRHAAYRKYFIETSGSIARLLAPLGGPPEEIVAPDLQRSLIATLKNLLVHHTNALIPAENPDLVPALLRALQTGTVETKANAAAAVSALSALEPTRYLIGTAALGPLIAILDEGDSYAVTDACSAIHSLCINDANKARAVENEAVRVLLRGVQARVHTDDMIRILAMLSSEQGAVTEMSQQGAIPHLFSVIRETRCERVKEDCMVIVHRICIADDTKRDDIRAEETEHRTISAIGRTGSRRSKAKAKAVLKHIRRR